MLAIIVRIVRSFSHRYVGVDALSSEWADEPTYAAGPDGKRVGLPRMRARDRWLAVPRRYIPGIHPMIAEMYPSYARDYREAWAIIDDSYRMSAVLARKVLADLLAKFANLTDHRLEKAIEKFIADKEHPRRIRDNMDYLRVIANLGAHTETDREGEVVEATKEEAEWTLELVSELFEYFIVDPAQDQAKQEAFNERLKKAGKEGMLPRNPAE